MKKLINIIVVATFILYSFIVLDIVLLSRATMFHTDTWIEVWSSGRLQYGVNLIPFHTISNYLKSIANGNIVRIATRNLLGNLFMFLPLGIYLPLIWKKCRKLISTLLVSVGVLVGIELVQFITLLGSLDIDDLILNLLGIMIGFILWKCLKIVRYFNFDK